VPMTFASAFTVVRRVRAVQRLIREVHRLVRTRRP
jgi:hypothetical protein